MVRSVPATRTEFSSRSATPSMTVTFAAPRGFMNSASAVPMGPAP